MSNNYKKLSVNVIIFAISNISIKLVQFFVMPLLTIYLTAEEYGLSDTLISLTDLLVPILTLELSTAIFRFAVDKRNKEEELISGSFYVILFTSIIFSVVVSVVYLFVKETYLFLLIPLIITYGFKQLFSSYVRGRGKTMVFAIGNIIQAVLLCAFSLLFLMVFDFGFSGYIWAMISSSFVSIIFFLMFANPLKSLRFSKINKEKLKEMLIYSLPSIPNMISWWVVQVTNRYIAIAYVGLALAGLYMAASKIPSLVNTASTIFLNAWSLSSAETSEDNDRNEYYQRIYNVYKILIIFGVAFTITLTPFISRILLQGEFYKAWVYSPMLILAAGAGCFSSFYGSFFGAFYKNKRAMITTLLGAVINILLSFILMKFIGVWGAAVSTLVAYFAIATSRIIYCRDLVKVKCGVITLSLSFLTLLAQSLFFSFYGQSSIRNLICSLIIITLLVLINIKSVVKLCKSVIQLFKNKFLNRTKQGDKL